MTINQRLFLQNNNNVAVYLTKLKTTIKPGLQIPSGLDPSQMGLWIESVLTADGFKLNKGPGPDIDYLGIEIKGRKDDAQSAFTFGTLSTNNILKTPWKQTTLYSKCQILLLVTYSYDLGIITEVDLLDLRDIDIQARLESAYELSRTQLSIEVKSGKPAYYIAPSPYAYFEWPNSKKYKKTYEFRISKGGLKKLKAMSQFSIDKDTLTWGTPFIAPKKTKNEKLSSLSISNDVIVWGNHFIEEPTQKNEIVLRSLFGEFFQAI